MDDIPLEDEPFEPFDNYDDYEEEMMNQAEKQDQLYSNSTSNLVSTSSSSSRNFASLSDSLPQQRDYLSLLQSQDLQVEKELERAEKQKQQQQQQRDQQRGQPSEKRQTIGRDTGDDDAVDLGAVKVGKKRVKLVRLDNERLLSDHGLSLLMENGKRFRVRSKYKDSNEKNANARNNLADLMRMYQTWAHNLFPKSTFKDFINQAESKCRSDRQIRATMEGWRDAYWNAIKDERETKEGAEIAEAEAQILQNNVWSEHEKAQQAQSSSTSMATDSGNIDTRPTQNTQPRPRPVTSRKGKEKAADAPSASTAMRLAASDDDDDDVDYERALNRLRISNNIDANSNNHIGSSTRKNEIDLDGYNSEVEDDEEEDAPLFTHRALQMMGAPEASAILGNDIPPTHSSTTERTIPENGSSESILNGAGTPSMNISAIELEPDLSMPTLPLDDISSIDDISSTVGNKAEVVQSMDIEDEDTLVRHKPMKGRRAILLDSSDEE